MTRLALRGLAARKLRTSLTVIAVLLGVTMIAGTFVLTDTIQKAFDEIFTSQTKGADVIVSGREAVDTEFTMPRPLDGQVLDDIKALPQVSQVAGQINDVAAVVGKDGKVVSTGGAPTIAATYMPKPFAAIGISEGKPPSGPDEIALDAATADKEGFKVGDTVTVAAGGPKKEFKLVRARHPRHVVRARWRHRRRLRPPHRAGAVRQAQRGRLRVRGRRSPGSPTPSCSATSPRSCRRPRRCGPPRRRPTQPATTSARACRS